VTSNAETFVGRVQPEEAAAAMRTARRIDRIGWHGKMT
jgi:hypothetical protein